MRKTLLAVLLSALTISIAGPLLAVTPAYVYYGFVERGGCQVQTVMWTSTTKVQCSYPFAQIDVYTDAAGTIHDTLYSDAVGTSLPNPFNANSDGSFLFYSNTLVDYVKGSGGGLPAAYQRTFYGTTAPTVTYITQASADVRYLMLNGSNSPMTGNLSLGTFAITAMGNLTSSGVVTINTTPAATPNLVLSGSSTTQPVFAQLNNTGTSGAGYAQLQIKHAMDTGKAMLRLTTGTGTIKEWLIGMNYAADFEIRDCGVGCGAGAQRFKISGSDGSFTFSNQGTFNDGLIVNTVNNFGIRGRSGSNNSANFQSNLDSNTASTVLIQESTQTAGQAANQKMLEVKNFAGTTTAFITKEGNASVSGTFAVGGTSTHTGNSTFSANVGIGQAPTAARLTVGAGTTGTNTETIRIDSGSGAAGYGTLEFFRNGVKQGFAGVSGSNNGLTAGDVANDNDYWSVQRFNWSANGGVNRHMILVPAGLAINGTGAVTNTDPLFPIHAKGQGTNQIVAEYDATHRSSVWHDATTGYVGTTTATPFKIRSNNTDAATVDTSQNINFAGAVGLNDNTAVYPFSAKKNGTLADSSSMNAVGVFQDATGAKGVFVGYSGALGAIAPVGGGELAFYGGAGAFAFGTDSAVSTGMKIGKISQYNSTACTTNGGCLSPTIVQSSVIGLGSAASLPFTPGFDGLASYRICWSQTITRAATTSSSLLTTISYTNVGAAKTSTYWVDPSAGTTGTTADASNVLGSERGNCITSLLSSSSTVTWATTYSTTGATTLLYAYTFTIEKMH